MQSFCDALSNFGGINDIFLIFFGYFFATYNDMRLIDEFIYNSYTARMKNDSLIKESRSNSVLRKTNTGDYINNFKGLKTNSDQTATR